MSGFAVVALHQPKIEVNVGHVMRGAHCFGAAMVVISGGRYKQQLTDTTKAFRSIPVVHTENLRESVPFDCVPVAVELLDDAESLVTFTHPARAFYIFGAEDRTLGKDVTSWCKHKVVIPTAYCLNLGMAVNVVLYDRVAKEARG